MSEPLDPATRARLEDAQDWLRRDEEDPEYIRLGGDIEALLAAYDAAVAERDKYLALWSEQGLVSRRYHEQAQDAATQNLTLRAERDAAKEKVYSYLHRYEAERATRQAYAAVVAAVRAIRTHWEQGYPGGWAVEYSLIEAAVAALPAEGT